MNKGAFFNYKTIMGNNDVVAMKLVQYKFENKKINEDTSRLLFVFSLPEEPLIRTIDFTFLNY